MSKKKKDISANLGLKKGDIFKEQPQSVTHLFKVKEYLDRELF